MKPDTKDAHQRSGPGPSRAGSSRFGVGRDRSGHGGRLRVAAILALPALLGSECSLSLGSGALPVDEIVVVPSAVELIPGGLASVEAIGRDRLGGRVDVAVRWASADTAVAAVTPRFATNTIIIGKTPGETLVVATHRRSGARDTVSVTVSPVAAGRAGPDALPRLGAIEVRPVGDEVRLESRYR